MENVTALDAKNKFGQVLEAAQRHPVRITKHGRPSAVLMSAAEYDRLRGAAWDRLLESMRRSSEYAAAQGLTEEKLEQLLADES